MISNEKEYGDYTLDDWIMFMSEKIEKTNNSEKRKKYEIALNEMKTIRDDGYIINDDIFTTINKINRAMSLVFDSWEYYTIDGNGSIVLYNDVVYINLGSKNDNVYCDVGFCYGTQPEIVAEISFILKDILGSNVSVISGCFYYNELDNTFIWGENEIIKHINRLKGYRKIAPVIVYDDKSIGHC